MRKLYTVLTAMAIATLGTSAFAAAGALGQASVVDSNGTEYTTSFPTSLELEWKSSSGEAQEITLVGNPSVQILINTTSGTVSPELVVNNDAGIELSSTRADADGSTSIRLDFYELYEKAGNPDLGEVTITIPAGIVQNSAGDTNETQKIHYNVVAQYPDSQITITPAPYTTLPAENLSQVTFAFDSSIKVLNNNPSIVINKELENWEFETSSYTGQITVSEKSFSLDLSYLDEGSYSIIIPDAYIMVGDDMINGQIWMGYTVFDGMASAEMIKGPGSIAAAGYLSPIMLTWDYQPISATSEGLTATISGYTAAWEEVSYTIPQEAFSFVYVEKPSDEPGAPSTGTRADDEYNVLVIEYAEYIGEIVGDLRIDIPEGIVENANSKVNPLEEIMFAIYNYAETLATVTVNEENQLVVTWEGFSPSSPAEDAPLFITDSSGERINLSYVNDFLGTGEVELNYESNSLDINLSSLNLGNGSYSLVIPEYSVLLNDENYNTLLAHEQYLDFEINDGKVSAVKTLQSEAVKAEVKGVYNLQGVKVADDALNLPAGLYIINGKKVLLKK